MNTVWRPIIGSFFIMLLEIGVECLVDNREAPGNVESLRNEQAPSIPAKKALRKRAIP